jgi:hypothetical protein
MVNYKIKLGFSFDNSKEEKMEIEQEGSGADY